MNNEKGSRACGLAVKLTRRVMQHAYAEPKYLGNLLYRGYEETVLLIKIVSMVYQNIILICRFLTLIKNPSIMCLYFWDFKNIYIKIIKYL